MSVPLWANTAWSQCGLNKFYIRPRFWGVFKIFWCFQNIWCDQDFWAPLEPLPSLRPTPDRPAHRPPSLHNTVLFSVSHPAQDDPENSKCAYLSASTLQKHRIFGREKWETKRNFGCPTLLGPSLFPGSKPSFCVSTLQDNFLLAPPLPSSLSLIFFCFFFFFFRASALVYLVFSSFYVLTPFVVWPKATCIFWIRGSRESSATWNTGAWAPWNPVQCSLQPGVCWNPVFQCFVEPGVTVFPRFQCSGVPQSHGIGCWFFFWPLTVKSKQCCWISSPKGAAQSSLWRDPTTQDSLTISNSFSFFNFSIVFFQYFSTFLNVF